MLSNLLFALGIAIALFIVSNLLLDNFVGKRYLSDAKREARYDEMLQDIQTYVTDNGLGYDDIGKMSEWSKKNKYSYVLIYKDDSLLFETGKNESGDADSSGGASSDKNETEESTKYPGTGITVRVPTRDELIALALERKPSKISTKDGELNVSMVEYSEYFYYDLFNILSILLGFVGFVVVMWLYFFEITKKITRLGREVTAVADGDVHQKITSDGEDEITRLCSDVEYMRISMLENLEKEHAALEANKELITAMSHDIRTPLTVLLGYIDIMKLNSPEGDMRQYIEASERTALRLKKMSDDMFGYFLVYGGGIEVEVEECDARTLIDQMLSGHVFLLREQGYNIEFNFENEGSDFLDSVIVVTDPPQLMRIVENLFSNIMKYADKEKNVTIQIGLETEEMTIKVCNYPCANPDEAQKNGIGLRSCMKLANALDIKFTSGEEDGVFISSLSIPIIPEIDFSEITQEEETGGFVEWLRSALQKCKSFFAKAWRKIKEFVLRKE